MDFKKHQEHGIEFNKFAEVLMMSGVVLTSDVKWIAFHGGYDFAYLSKVLNCKSMPVREDMFAMLLSRYFPNFYDVKHLMKSVENLSGGLQSVADHLQIPRIGPRQAGSDSLMTGNVFFKM